jgi:hypothetical protein
MRKNIFIFVSIFGDMSLDTLDRLGVPVHHPFCRSAIIAWWYVPSKNEDEYFHVLELIWTHVVTPRLASLVFAYFRAIIPRKDYPTFHQCMLSMIESLVI